MKKKSQVSRKIENAVEVIKHIHTVFASPTHFFSFKILP